MGASAGGVRAKGAARRMWRGGVRRRAGRARRAAAAAVVGARAAPRTGGPWRSPWRRQGDDRDRVHARLGGKSVGRGAGGGGGGEGGGRGGACVRDARRGGSEGAAATIHGRNLTATRGVGGGGGVENASAGVAVAGSRPRTPPELRGGACRAGRGARRGGAWTRMGQPYPGATRPTARPPPRGGRRMGWAGWGVRAASGGAAAETRDQLGYSTRLRPACQRLGHV